MQRQKQTEPTNERVEEELLSLSRKEGVVLLPKKSLFEERKIEITLRTPRHTHRAKQFKNGHIHEHAKFNSIIQDGKTVSSFLSMSNSRSETM